MILAPENCGCPLVEEGASVANSPICGGTLLFLALVESFVRGRCDIATPCKRIKPVSVVRKEYDFIVVGGGTAGAIVASRLAENKYFKVLLLEAGGPEPTAGRVPSFYRNYASNPEVDWMYRTVSENYCLDQDGKGCLWPRGKVLGGTALLNGMMCSRGHEGDYDDWEDGWSWQDNLPYFLKFEDNKEIGTVVSAKYHAVGGPMPIKRFNYQPPFLYDLLEALNQTGLPIVQDMNDPHNPSGFTIAQTFSSDGQRYTTARAYLSRRPNLDVALHAHVSKVLTKTVGGRTRAVGVQYYDKVGKLKIVHATKEVILSAGACNTPQILMLSGIGPKETLHKFKIPIVKELPVGRNLRNHIGVVISYIATKLENLQELSWAAFTEYLLNKQGPMSGTGITQLSGFLFSSLADKERKQPDLQFFFNGYYAECSHTGQVGEKVGDCPSSGTNFSSSAVALLPRSVGYVDLSSTDPFDPPLFYANYFSHPDDMVMVKEAALHVKNIFETDVMKNKFGVKLDPSKAEKCAEWETWSDDWLECLIRQNTDPQNHQIGTAAIGLVIDPKLRVYGIPNLRVIDAASIPTLMTGNPQAPIMMVAERGAHFIKQDWS